MVTQIEFQLKPFNRGIHLIGDEVISNLPKLPATGLLSLFIKHTSAAICINEGADPDVRRDMETIYNFLVPENMSYYTHTSEGPDDMPAHAKAIITGNSLTVPITNGKLNLGTWQDIYLCEFRNDGGRRRIVATIFS